LAGAKDEAVEALVALGYKPAEADKMVKVVDGENLNTEELIRQALQSK
jgi:Holliday junction DNA helicase RuvA